MVSLFKKYILLFIISSGITFLILDILYVANIFGIMIGCGISCIILFIQDYKKHKESSFFISQKPPTELPIIGEKVMNRFTDLRDAYLFWFDKYNNHNVITGSFSRSMLSVAIITENYEKSVKDLLMFKEEFEKDHSVSADEYFSWEFPKWTSM